MDVNAGVKVLQLFNEKADKLESLSFTKKLQGSGVTISATLGQPVQVQWHGPDDEAIDAFVLTMRFFVQDNESISFRNMADLYSKLPVCPELAQKFDDAHAKTNADLDRTTPIILNNVDLTYRAVYDVFLWGGLAHANPKKKAVYDSWAQNPILFPLLQNEFVRALGIILNMIYFTRAINKVALSQMLLTSQPDFEPAQSVGVVAIIIRRTGDIKYSWERRSLRGQVQEKILFAANCKDYIVANIGNGYGSECHLLRWMGRHRNLFDERVSNAVGRPGANINWLDFGFAPNKLWSDAELKGLEFLYDQPGLRPKWEEFWPTARGIHNWDAVGWIGAEPHRELLLLEAKAHVDEMKSDCGAKSSESIRKIERAFDEVKRSLGVSPGADWMRGHYQAANRIATLYFVQRERVLARLLFVYFLGDRFPSKECPRTEEEWKPAINAQWAHLGFATDHCLANRVHGLFLPISVPSP